MPNQDATCGSFMSGGDRPGGYCDKAFPATAFTDAALLAQGSTGYASVRQVEPKDTTQFGIRLQKKSKDTEITGAISQYDSRRSYVGWIRGAAETLTNGANNPVLVQTYAKAIKQFDLGIKSQLEPDITYYIDYTLKNDQPLSLPLGDMFQGFATAQSANTFVRNRVLATSRGGFMQGWDTFSTSDIAIGGTKIFKNIAAAETIAVRAEMNGSFVHDLPDQSQTRYGRADAFGVILANNSCNTTATILDKAVTCSYDGFTSSSAYAVSINAIATYANAIPGVVIRPSIGYKKDIKGWSYDNSINEGTEQIRVGLEATYQGFISNITYVGISGGKYQVQRDKDYLMMSLQKRFK